MNLNSWFLYLIFPIYLVCWIDFLTSNLDIYLSTMTQRFNLQDHLTCLLFKSWFNFLLLILVQHLNTFYVCLYKHYLFGQWLQWGNPNEYTHLFGDMKLIVNFNLFFVCWKTLHYKKGSMLNIYICVILKSSDIDFESHGQG